jgi:hypothetical protein
VVEGAAAAINLTSDSLNGTSLVAADGYGVFAISYPHQGHVSTPHTALYAKPQFVIFLSLSLFTHFIGHGCKDSRLWAGTAILLNNSSIGKLQFFTLNEERESFA